MKNVCEYIISDCYRYTGKKKSAIGASVSMLFTLDRGKKYLFWLRLCQNGNLLQPLAIVIHKFLSLHYGIEIPRQVKIGYGLYLGHAMSIVVNPNTKIGDNVNLSHFLSIGTNDGHAATIGDNVYVAPHVSIVGGVVIGDNVSIGAGAVVVKDIPRNATVAGVPAKILNYNNPARFIGNRYKK